VRGKRAFLPSPSLAGEGGRGNAASLNTAVIQDFYVWDFAANPYSGFLGSGLFHSGKVRGTFKRYV
jgi:hypothetical protein